MTGQTPKITLSGTPEKIGYYHGRLLADQIHQNIKFYKSILLAKHGDETHILKLTDRYKEQIMAFNPNYITKNRPYVAFRQ